MGTESGVDTSRAVVQTYVPKYQREEWDDHADDLGMSRSEFVRSMVQAGRRGFGAETEGEPSSSAEESSGSDGGLSDDEQLRERIVDVIEREEVLSWDELVAAVAGDVETRIERTLGELQERGIVRHSGRQGGYIVDQDADE